MKYKIIILSILEPLTTSLTTPAFSKPMITL